MSIPVTEQSKHMGTTRMIESGSFQTKDRGRNFQHADLGGHRLHVRDLCPFVGQAKLVAVMPHQLNRLA
jgi:hypothetical protein